ncbi:MAG: hypothetical protein C5B55_06460 [Blastocatellia bacterium]|nr:MAG: hypothetical protein C5B55_06460 [Blastocatellia bacterium]
MQYPGADYEVVIAGGGPAGTSAAIHLAQQNVRVLLVEQKVFPRHKLCGEFISPECTQHFERLGVAGEMNAASPALLNQTIFYSRHGRSVQVPSQWFGSGGAMGLSRAMMDQNLMQRAKQVGVDVIENATVSGVLQSDNLVCGVRMKIDGVELQRTALLTIDATGRKRILTRRLSTGSSSRAKWIAFKAHLTNTQVAPGVCEIYSYPGGYGGLSTIERGLSNLCFIVSAKHVRRFHSDTETVLRKTVLENRRAAKTLAGSMVQSDWLSVALESFGRQRPVPTAGLLAIGDSAAFIDPLTGSGMLMALESGELAARTFVRYRNKLGRSSSLTDLSREYTQNYGSLFDRRLRTSGLLRRLAFNPQLAEAAILLTGASDRLRSRLARATRPNNSFSKVQ